MKNVGIVNNTTLCKHCILKNGVNQIENVQAMSSIEWEITYNHT